MKLFASLLAAAVAALMAGAALADTPTATSSATATTSTATSTATATTTATSTPGLPAVTDAAAFRDDLLTLGMGNLSAQESAGFDGFFPVWATAYPGLRGVGYAVPAGNGTVSVYRNLLHPKDLGSPANPTVIAFAVTDVSGRCAGGVIYGFPKTDRSTTVASATPCTAQAVVSAFSASFQPPSTATATATGAPLPPATGAGQTESAALPLLAAAGVALAAAGLAGVVAARRR
ncbi:MAG: hypothetical protein IT429_11755 [Gemmataceae bacterium]|nr:hypothetical protein [Gemmataceae bacterium]